MAMAKKMPIARNQRLRRRSAQKINPPARGKTGRIWIIAGLTALVLIAVFFVIKRFYSPAAGPAVRAVETLPPASVPEIVSARIVPERPQANAPLTVEYQAREPGGVPVQYTFRWHVDGGIVQEGESPALEPGSVQKGESVFVEIIPTSANGQGKPFKSEPLQIANIPPSILSVSISPSQPAPGTVITTAVAAEDADRDEVSFRYAWTVNGEPVADLPPDSSTFDTRKLRKKDNVSVTVTPLDGEEDGKPVLSDIVELMNSAPRITSMPPAALDKGVYAYQVTASDPDGDKIVYSLAQSPEGMTIDPASGLIRWEPPKQVPERKEISVKIKADDGDGGTVSQEYSFFLEAR